MFSFIISYTFLVELNYYNILIRVEFYSIEVKLHVKT